MLGLIGFSAASGAFASCSLDNVSSKQCNRDIYDPQSDVMSFLQTKIETKYFKRDNMGLVDSHDASSEFIPLQSFVGNMSGSTCLSVVGGVGGLANTVEMLNTVLDHAIDIGAEFAWPPVTPDEGESYYYTHEYPNSITELFGVETCKRQIDIHSTQCNYDIPQAVDEHLWLGTHLQKIKHSCAPSQLEVARKGNPMPVKWCGCDRVVLVDAKHTIWHADYSKTGHLFREKYWNAHPAKLELPNSGGMKIPGSTPISVTLHVRLGDVAEFSRKDKELWYAHWGDINVAEKYTDPDFYVQALKSLEHFFPQDTMHVTIVTENGNHRDVRKIIAAARDNVTVQHGNSVEIDFNSMTHSDVLIAGGSHFGRLAALLQTQTKPSIRILTDTPSQPFTNMTDTIEIKNWADAISILSHNNAIRSLMARVSHQSQ